MGCAVYRCPAKSGGLLDRFRQRGLRDVGQIGKRVVACDRAVEQLFGYALSEFVIAAVRKRAAYLFEHNVEVCLGAVVDLQSCLSRRIQSTSVAGAERSLFLSHPTVLLRGRLGLIGFLQALVAGRPRRQVLRLPASLLGEEEKAVLE
jgi:hypothetical protein